MTKIVESLQSLAVPLNTLTLDPANARAHTDKSIDAIAQSLAAYGQRTPIVAQKKADGTLIVRKGNGTTQAAKSLGWDNIAAVIVEESDTTATGYAIADNRTAELSDWNANTLADLLTSLDGEGVYTAYSDGDLSALLADLEPLPEKPTTPDAKEERKEELLEKWGVELGQTWKIGRHTLHCADSTTVDLPEFDTLFFDPPWEIGAVPPECDSVLAFTDGFRAGGLFELFYPMVPAWVFTWDCVTRWFTNNRPLRGAKQCFWYGNVEDYNYKGSHYGEPGEPGTITNSRGTYEYVPDPRGKHLADVFRSPITQVPKEGGLTHAKPVDWLRCLIANCTTGVVFDPFNGSGSSMVACEQIGRTMIAVELNPQMVACTLDRMEQMGLKPELLNG